MSGLEGVSPPQQTKQPNGQTIKFSDGKKEIIIRFPKGTTVTTTNKQVIKVDTDSDEVKEVKVNPEDIAALDVADANNDGKIDGADTNKLENEQKEAEKNAFSISYAEQQKVMGFGVLNKALNSNLKSEDAKATFDKYNFNATFGTGLNTKHFKIDQSPEGTNPAP